MQSKVNVLDLCDVVAILDLAKSVDCASICSFCSRMKRGRIYTAARRENYNVLAMGQHLDDLAERYTFIIASFMDMTLMIFPFLLQNVR